MTSSRPRFSTPYDPGNSETRRRWIAALENLGVENLRIRLAQHGGGSAADLYGIAGEQAVTRGFAEAWANYEERRVRRRRAFVASVPRNVVVASGHPIGGVTQQFSNENKLQAMLRPRNTRSIPARIH